MCGIAGIVSLQKTKYPYLNRYLRVMGALLKHRGPDDNGFWAHHTEYLGFAHQRLSVIDLSQNAQQPMSDRNGNWIVFNGEIYNYLELRKELGEDNFVTQSDTEVILFAYRKWGVDCVNHFRGMFAFALWDEKENRVFCARDHFGIKPFYYLVVDKVFYFASEIKALLPFIPEFETDLEGFKDYLSFQLCLNGKTLFKNVSELLPAHQIILKDANLNISRYWEVIYNPDFHHTANYFEEELNSRLQDSITMHLRSDVPVGAYVSGGVDSSTIASIATDIQGGGNMMGFTGKFSQYGSKFDESEYAQAVADEKNFELKSIDISATDFINNIEKVIYHLDYPVAGPGSFPQYMVSELASKYRKVVLGGQGGDEIFGGYTRYLIAYFEQCIKGAIEGSMSNGNYVVTYESIIPNLVALKNYKPMLKEFWKNGLFDSMDKRYFQLVNRAPTLDKEVNWELLEPYSSRETFSKIFNGKNVKKESYFDLMTHFDFKTLLPALLQVEDRMSMAHSLESRVPLLDRSIVELAATIPANIKFKNGDMKHIFKNISKAYLPEKILKRTDKMGFPTPLTQWFKDEASEFIYDIFSSQKALSRDLINNDQVLQGLSNEGEYGRKLWGLLSLEIWQQQFHDKAHEYRKMLD